MGFIYDVFDSRPGDHRGSFQRLFIGIGLFVIIGFSLELIDFYYVPREVRTDKVSMSEEAREKLVTNGAEEELNKENKNQLPVFGDNHRVVLFSTF